MKKLLAVLALVMLIVGGWYFASPWIAMKGLADAAKSGDAAQLERRVDFPALRASVSDQISEATRRRQGQGGVLDQIGGVLAERIGRATVDRALTPQSVGNLVISGGFAVGLLPQRLRGQEIDWSVERKGLDFFHATGTFEDGTAGPTLIFARDGLDWKLTGFELP